MDTSTKKKKKLSEKLFATLKKVLIFVFFIYLKNVFYRQR